MSYTNQAEDDQLDLQFTNVAAPNWGDASGLQPSAVAGSIYVSLHTGSAISDTDTAQTANETGYQNYARIAVARAVAQWTVASGTVDNDNAITFAQAGSTGVPSTVTDVGLGFALSGAGYLQMFGALTASLVINQNVTPEFAAGALDVSLD